jgi:hypothetical protein
MDGHGILHIMLVAAEARKEATMDYDAVEGDYSGSLNQAVAATEFRQPRTSLRHVLAKHRLIVMGTGCSIRLWLHSRAVTGNDRNRN